MRIETQKENLDLRAIIEEIEHSMSSKVAAKEVKLKIEVDQDTPTDVYGDCKTIV